MNSSQKRWKRPICNETLAGSEAFGRWQHSRYTTILSKGRHGRAARREREREREAAAYHVRRPLQSMLSPVSIIHVSWSLSMTASTDYTDLACASCILHYTRVSEISNTARVCAVFIQLPSALTSK